MTDELFRKRSLEELDEVIEEIIGRNPEWYQKVLEKIDTLKEIQKQNTDKGV